MGNRAVITTRKNFDNNGIGIYLHWNGGRDSVEAFLKYCEMKGYRPPSEDSYGWARLCQVIGNFFGGTLSVGIDTVDNLDCDNWDNGTYIIDGWEIVDREHYNGVEQYDYPLEEMLELIDSRMPKEEQFGAYLTGRTILPKELKIGDTIAFIDYHGRVTVDTVVGIGKCGKVVNGHDVANVPYIARYYSDSCPAEDNPNNYLFDDREYRII